MGGEVKPKRRPAAAPRTTFVDGREDGEAGRALVQVSMEMERTRLVGGVWRAGQGIHASGVASDKSSWISCDDVLPASL